MLDALRRLLAVNIAVQMICLAAAAFALLLLPPKAAAGSTHIAVASNFSEAIKLLAPIFEQHTEHTLTLSLGSSGKLFAQARQGAPYDVFLSADQAKPQALMDLGLTASPSVTYAIGQLVLWQPDASDQVSTNTLIHSPVNKLAIANPRLAPYGVAALEVIDYLNLNKSLSNRLVRGENVSQAFQFVHSGNAQAGFIARSQVNHLNPKAYWVVPQSYYTPIKQNAVLLRRAKNKPSAQAFFNFIQSKQAQEHIKNLGYAISEKRE